MIGREQSKALVAFVSEDGGGYVIEGTQYIRSCVECGSPHVEDVFSRVDLKGKRGLWVWEGEVVIDDGRNGMFEPTDPDVSFYRGSWRRPRARELMSLCRGECPWPNEQEIAP